MNNYILKEKNVEHAWWQSPSIQKIGFLFFFIATNLTINLNACY